MTRKITRGLARIKLGLEQCLYLGNLNARRDWGHARDYVEMQWLMLQQERADDYVIATGRYHSVKQFVDATAAVLGMKIRWQGEGIDEKGIDDASGRTIISVDPRYFRPTEVDALIGDSTKARERLGWKPGTSFEELVREMAEEDYRLAQRDDLVSKAGYRSFKYFE